MSQLSRGRSRRFGIQAVLSVAILVVSSACFGDPGTVITVANRLSEPIKFGAFPVGLDFNGRFHMTTEFEWRNLQIREVPPNHELRMGTSILPNRKYGSRNKYLVVAITPKDIAAYERLFTWDELEQLGWRVVIEPTVS